ncbi:MAG: hypothetical protein EPO35_04735 [Acidobacteria bacterium]|nr:MAG: hypothetical protein EPO35_04735 [Acidobacteriota bacterium]
MRAMIGLGRNRLSLGRDLRLINADGDAVWLEGTVRLRPGQAVDLVGHWPTEPMTPRGHVVSWHLTRLGPEGPIYRGCVRLQR